MTTTSSRSAQEYDSLRIPPTSQPGVGTSLSLRPGFVCIRSRTGQGLQPKKRPARTSWLTWQRYRIARRRLQACGSWFTNYPAHLRALDAKQALLETQVASCRGPMCFGGGGRDDLRIPWPHFETMLIKLASSRRIWIWDAVTRSSGELLACSQAQLDRLFARVKTMVEMSRRPKSGAVRHRGASSSLDPAPQDIEDTRSSLCCSK